MTTPVKHWQAVALSRNIDRKPLRILFQDQPVVLFRSENGISALADRCPHRLAELSKGKIINGEIECPYHGWRFDGAGSCTAIPGLLDKVPNYHIPSYQTCEKEGVLFISRHKTETTPYLHCMEGKPVLMRLAQSRTRSDLLDTAENILDATHTHFVHKGLLRGLSDDKQKIQVDITGGDGWVEACYTGEEQQQGLVSKLLEGERTKTIGRFLYPGIAELEYWGPEGLVLATTFHLRQADEAHVEGIGCLIGPRNGALDYLKSLAFIPMFKIALQQDRRILGSASRNKQFFPDMDPLVGPLDILRKDMERILEGHLPEAANTPQTLFMEL